jgi:hypothetical protein
MSLLLGVYVNANGDVVAEVGVTEPSPFSVSVTFVAPPPNLFPLIVTDVNPHVLPLVLLKVTVGGFTHCPDPSNEVNRRRQANRKPPVR